MGILKWVMNMALLGHCTTRLYDYPTKERAFTNIVTYSACTIDIINFPKITHCQGVAANLHVAVSSKLAGMLVDNTQY